MDARGAMAIPETVWWFVPAGEGVRHATAQPPGAWIQGASLSVLCGNGARAPYATPYGRTPSSAAVHRRCGVCEVTASESTHQNWDA
jgi:hypothetical protein